MCANNHCASFFFLEGPQIYLMSKNLDNQLALFPCLDVCVCLHMCEHSLHGHATELAAQQGVSRVLEEQPAQLWQDSSCYSLTSAGRSRSGREGVGHTVIHLETPLSPPPFKPTSTHRR